jgi:hypothetical protein
VSIVDDIKVAFSEAMAKLDSRLGGMEQALHAQTKHLKGGVTKRRARFQLSGVTNGTKEDVTQTFQVPAGEQWYLRSQAFQPTNPVAGVALKIVEGQLANIAALNPANIVYTAGGIGAQGVVTTFMDIMLKENTTYTVYVLSGEAAVPWSINIDVLKEHLEPDTSTTVGTDD